MSSPLVEGLVTLSINPTSPACSIRFETSLSSKEARLSLETSSTAIPSLNSSPANQMVLKKSQKKVASSSSSTFAVPLRRSTGVLTTASFK